MREAVFFSILITLFSGKHVYGNPICDGASVENKKLENFLKAKEIDLEKFSNRKEIATKADQTLSNLISAKSKIIFGWLKHRNLGSASEVEIAKAWRRYYAENFVLRQYPDKDKTINALVGKLIEDLYFKFLPKKEQTRIELIFEEAKELALKRVKAFNIKEKQKAQILSRVAKIKLYWMEKFKSSKFAQNPLEVFSWGVAYDPVTNEINMGLEVLQYANDETLFSVFAHEIGHSFDPCRWGAFFKGKNPFQKLITCLRGEQSVNAKKRDDSKMSLMVKKGKLSKGLAEALKQNPYCNKQAYPPIGVQADQIPETFADWFSAEVVSTSKYLNKNLRNDLCASKKLIPGTSYPTNKDRLEKIYLSHPKIKKHLNYNNKSAYCSP